MCSLRNAAIQQCARTVLRVSKLPAAVTCKPCMQQALSVHHTVEHTSSATEFRAMACGRERLRYTKQTWFPLDARAPATRCRAAMLHG